MRNRRLCTASAISARWQDRIAGRLARTEQTIRVQIARDELRRVRELTRSIDALEHELAAIVATIAPQLLAERGCGALTAAKLIGEIAGINRFATDAKLARLAGTAPIPASSGNSTRHRLDRGGNRQLNCALHRLPISKSRHDPAPEAACARRSRGPSASTARARSGAMSMTASSRAGSVSDCRARSAWR